MMSTKITILGMIFAFVWASFLPPVRQNNSNDDILGELVMQNNTKPPQLEVKTI